MQPRQWINSVAAVVVVIIIELAVFFAILYSGVISIAASEPHYALTRWLLETAMERSMERHSSGITAPESYPEQQVAEGFRHFDEMCVTCHAAPGIKRSEIAQGMRPNPPELEMAAPGLKDAEIYWIVKHGIKFTGMPSFGNTHPDEDIRGIVGFVKRLPDMSPQEYTRWKQSKKTH